MMSGKNQSGQAPTAFGSMLQASTYGMTIPVIYGRTISPALAIWANNLRQAGSSKKFKQLKKGITAYCENIDFLLGKNPILGTLQFYVNNGKYPLNFVAYSFGAGLSSRVQVGNFAGLPDPNFYAVIGVTVAQTYTVTFDDYGGSGPRTLTGSHEIPLWNEAVSGPDPTQNSGYRNWPYTYSWKPGDGPYVTVNTFLDALLLKTVTIHYAQLSSATIPDTPLSKLRLHWEARLGDGDEYDGNIQGTSTPLSTQQIIYDEYAGIGSASIDLGSSGTIPSIKPELQGKFGLYPSGDCDFVDIIEDILKSGITQAGIGGSVGFGATQHGVGCFDYPGCIQQKSWGDTESFTRAPIPYNLPVTLGNFLVVVAATNGIGGAALSVSDSSGNTWTPVFSGAPSNQVWYAQANASGPCTVTVTGQSFDWSTMLLEIAGVDTFDSVSIGASGTASMTTTNAPGLPAYLLAFGLYPGASFSQPAIPQWSVLTAKTYLGVNPAGYSVQERSVQSPGTYAISIPSASLAAQCILAFKCVQPPSNPKPLVDFLDQPSADLTRKQCRAAGLWGSLSMASQKAASEWIGDLVTAANCAPVYSGFRLKLIPRSEVSAVGNGAVYIAPTASGPVADLDADRGDFIGTTPIQCVRTARTDLDTVLQMQHLNRNSDYQQVVTAEADPASIALYGTRKKDPIVNNAIQDVAVAQPILRIMTRRQNYVDPLAYKFKLNARWGLLEAMDLVTITDRQQGIFKVPVRLKSVEEDDKYENDCEAEPFIYGISAPQTIAVTNPTSYRPGTNEQVVIGVNYPIIFEPTPRLAHQTSPAQIWCVVSDSDPNYGGCIPYLSTDGGRSYSPVSDSPIIGSALQGGVTVDWPANTDPDTTDDLAIFFQSTLPAGVTIPSYTAAQRDKFQYPAYVGFSPHATSTAAFTAGDSAQITELDVLFSGATLNNALPSDATILNIFPMIYMETLTADFGSPAVAQAYYGTGMTPTSGGLNLFGPFTGPFPATIGSATPPNIGTSLTGAEIRYRLTLPTTGAAACTGHIRGVGWAIFYNSAAPIIDPLVLAPFGAPAGSGWGWAVPGTVTLGQVGTGTNGSIVANGAVAPPGMGYEIISYNKATMHGLGDWTINATGTGNAIRRGVDAAPAPGVGMDHPPESPFALLDPGGGGLVKINMDPVWIGTQLLFKFLPFNTFGGVTALLANCQAFPYTPTGIPGNIGPATGGILVNGT
jgi:hypothetical protein